MSSDDGQQQDLPVVINKWDINAVKNALDDGVKKCLVEEFDYDERFRLIDGRLAISAVAVSLGDHRASTVPVGFSFFAVLWDWFYPFPASKTVLIICVIAYFSLMTALQLYAWFVEGTTFYVAVDEDPTGREPDLVWSVSSRMQRYESDYELEISVSEVGGKHLGEGTIEIAITKWIDDQGEVLQDLIDRDILKLHNSLLPSKKNK